MLRMCKFVCVLMYFLGAEFISVRAASEKQPNLLRFALSRRRACNVGDKDTNTQYIDKKRISLSDKQLHTPT